MSLLTLPLAFARGFLLHRSAPVRAFARPGQKHTKSGFFLCWAVAFADIGTSVYYTSGILYGQVGKLARFFVALTMIVFILLMLKYAEVTSRYPQGGGVVTVAANVLWPWAGALGGRFILVDYFFTAAISSLSGLTYFAIVVSRISPVVFLITLVVFLYRGQIPAGRLLKRFEIVEPYLEDETSPTRLC
jgi:amino acid transporter